MKHNAGNIKKGTFILHNSEIWQVMKAEFYSPGKGSALMRSTLKNIKSGRTLAFTFKSNEPVDTVEVETIELQYLYKDQDSIYLMNSKTYEQHQLSIKLVENIIKFIKEGEILLILMYEDKPIGIRAPMSIKLKVIEAENAVKGDTMTSPKKTVKVETGATVLVPMSIKVGDVLSVRPETGEYIERISLK